METRKRKLCRWLRKHWLPLTVAFLGLTLLVVLAIGSIRRFQATTPIASIDPDGHTPEERLPEERLPEGRLSVGRDPIRRGSNFRQPSRLERYQKEIEEISRHHARRQRSLETIVAMDFGRMGREATELEAPVDSLHEKQEPAQEKSSAAGRKRGSSPVPVPARPQARQQRTRKNVKPTLVAGPSDPFYTVKAQMSYDSFPEEREGLYSAVVHGDQELQPNATLSLRLLEEIVVGAHRFPRNTLLYGKLSGASSGRLKVRILSIGSVPVRMQVFDQDYQEGIVYVQEEPLPSAIAESRDDALDQLLHSVPYGGVAGGLAGLGRTILRKSRKGKSVFLADGYPLFVSLE